MLYLLLILLVLVAFILIKLQWKTRRLAAQAEIAVPQAGQIMPVTDGAIHFVDLGAPDAPPLVLIHGLSGQLQHFTFAMAQDLARDFRVIIPDRPGCGYSRRDGDDLADPSAQARMLWHFLDAILVKDPVVVGHSLGGTVALAMALDRPGQIKALGLIAPLTHPVKQGPDTFKGLAVRSPVLRRILGHTLAVPMAERMADSMLKQIFAPEACPDTFLAEAGAVLGLRPQAYISASADMIAAEDALPDQSMAYAHATLPPGGVLFGDQDAILDYQTQGQAMEKYGFSVKILPNRGHMLPITMPEETNSFVRQVAALAQSA